MKSVKTIGRWMAALTLVVAGQSQARDTRLTCRDSGNVYARPYAVVVDSRNMTLLIARTTGTFAGRRSYPIVQVEKESEGFVVTAHGPTLNATIKVAVSVDEKWISWTDALTDRSFAIDYCR